MKRTEPLPGGAGQQAAAEATERFSLAPGVEFVGEMRETGFVNRQWLLQRDGRYVQLTELLYRTAEQVAGDADGRTFEEIAAGVTRSTDWLMTSDDVRYLLQTKLVPLGVVIPAGETPPGETTPSPRRTASPLAFNLRTEVFGPRVIDPATKVLQVLFAPFVLVPMLVAIVLAHGWLYLVHGAWESIREVLYTPGLMLAVLGLAILAGVFHEFGHASALRYGGGRARTMGVGLYLIYPAFYTDTTDSYRLGRWARVRTDLGGFYFHLLFALGVMGSYFATGQEFLLFFVLLINLDIVYQCMPFVRFDGYWALADLTGVPDFFSQMGAFLRSVLPLGRWKGNRLPSLKPWVKTVFAFYVAVTVPVLFLLLFLLVTRLPGIAAAAWGSLLLQARGFSLALEGGDVLGMLASATQATILALQILGISYLLYAVGRMLVATLWKWIGPARRRDVRPSS